MMIRIQVDFNSMAPYFNKRLPLDVPTLLEADKDILNKLQQGDRVVVYEPNDVEYEAVLEYDEELKMWFGILDETTRRELLDSPDEQGTGSTD